MKHVKYLFVAGLFAAVILMGCGVNKTENKSDKNYSKQATVPTQNPSKRVERFANSTNRYCAMPSSYDKTGIIQKDLKDVTDIREIEIEDFGALCWVTDEWIYYIAYEPDNHRNDSLYRIPLQKENGAGY